MCSRTIVPVIKQMPYINSTMFIGLRKFNSRTTPRGKPKMKKRLAMDSLPEHRLPHDFIEYESTGTASHWLQEELKKWENNMQSMRATESNFIESSRLKIHLEEATEQVRIENCNQYGVKLYPVDGDENEFFFFVQSTEMKDLCATVKQFTEFDLITKNGSRVDGQVIFKDDNKIFVDLDTVDHWGRDQLYDIIFRYNRKFYLLQYQALHFIQSHKLFDVLINNPKYDSTTSESLSYDCKYELPGVLENFDLNEEQKDATVNIVRGDYYPLPYLLYGPAGTGKTKTLVATILNIVESSDSNILVCTQSNDACDEITVRLKQYMDESIVFRMYTPSKDMEKIPKTALTYANYFGDELHLPPIKFIYKYRVVICTLAMAGCLTRARCSPNHFNYVIIDECASALETMTLVPIVGLCTTEHKLHAKVVLAGDPKQLDAVTLSKTADELGYSTSLLEHLFNRPLYKRDPVSGKFNTKYITQLVKNYRSHPAILHVPNQLFYDGTLKTEVLPQITDLNVQLPQLNENFPVIFKSVQGLCIQPDDDTSSYNEEEMREVMAYIRTILNNNDQLKQSDIGVISPYRLQCEYLKLICERSGFPDVTIGTAERFQGQERKIIIVSTVCSRSESVGTFVSDPQRLNVMLTRAQYLLIVVGDPHTLDTNPHWHEFIKYCYTNGSLVQSDNYFVLNNGSRC